MTSTATAETNHQDNLFGVCNALGEDFGFNPLYLRLALAVGFLFRPENTVAAYFAVGLVILAARLAFPNPKVASNSAPVQTTTPVVQQETEAPIEFARAA